MNEDAFARRVGVWFEREGRSRIHDPVYLRQMNMAIALAASRWNEFAAGPDPVVRMDAWLTEVERRATERRAEARVEAFALVRAWLDES
jgi:hypothetical protein